MPPGQQGAEPVRRKAADELLRSGSRLERRPFSAGAAESVKCRWIKDSTKVCSPLLPLSSPANRAKASPCGANSSVDSVSHPVSDGRRRRGAAHRCLTSCPPSQLRVPSAAACPSTASVSKHARVQACDEHAGERSLYLSLLLV